MPPNLKGGKNYKKGKKGGGEGVQSMMIERQEGQMIGRVIRILGNRNMLIYSNDSKLRICKVCGKMKGRVWIELGDIVLISLRSFGENDTSADRGDIIGKYTPDLHSKLRKEAGVNDKIFMKLEVMSGMSLDELGTAPKIETDDDLFEFDDSAGNATEANAEGEAEDGEEGAVNIDAI